MCRRTFMGPEARQHTYDARHQTPSRYVIIQASAFTVDKMPKPEDPH